MSLSLSAEIATYLEGLSLPTSLNFDGVGTVNLFATLLPDAPDVAVAVIPRPGIAPVSIMTGKTPGSGGSSQPRLAFARPRISVMTRVGSSDYVAGNALAEAIFGALHGLNETYLNGNTNAYFHWIEAVQSPAYLGDTGGRERQLWSQAFSVWWEDPGLA